MEKVLKVKPELFRLVTLDAIVISGCAWLLFKNAAPQMFVPILIAKLTILSYALYLLAQKTRQKQARTN